MKHFYLDSVFSRHFARSTSSLNHATMKPPVTHLQSTKKLGTLFSFPLIILPSSPRRLGDCSILHPRKRSFQYFDILTRVIVCSGPAHQWNKAEQKSSRAEKMFLTINHWQDLKYRGRSQVKGSIVQFAQFDKMFKLLVVLRVVSLLLSCQLLTCRAAQPTTATAAPKSCDLPTIDRDHHTRSTTTHNNDNQTTTTKTNKQQKQKGQGGKIQGSWLMERIFKSFIPLCMTRAM